MPLIQVKVIENVFTPEQKKEIISRLTDAMVAVEGEKMREVTWVTLEDVKSGDWGIGGIGLTTGDVRNMMCGENSNQIRCLDLETLLETLPFTDL